MEREYTKTDCPLYASEYCRILNMESCRSCTVECDTADKAEHVRAELDVISANLPQGGIQGLFAGDECLLCKDAQKKGAKSYYALTDLGHAEPKRHKAAILGISREPRSGTVLPIQIACCDKCRKRYLALEYASPVMGAAFAAAALILMSIRPIREAIAAIAPVLPIVVFAAIVAVGVAGGALVQKTLAKRYAPLMHTDIMEIPLLNAMADKGWYEIYPQKRMSKLVFSKTPIKQGMFTAFPAVLPESGAQETPDIKQNNETV